MIWCGYPDTNKSTEKDCDIVFEESEFQFTSPGIPYKNGVVEHGFW